MNPSERKTSWILCPLALLLSCGGGTSKPPPHGLGFLRVQPNPAKVTPGASVALVAVPDEANSGAPGIAYATWSIQEANGGTIVALTAVGESARYTAPAQGGIFHVKAEATPVGWYAPIPTEVDVIDPATVSVSVMPSKITIGGVNGPVPILIPATIPLTNQDVTWSILESDFATVASTGIVTILANWSFDRSAQISYDPKRLGELPGTSFHIKVQSQEVPSAFALVQVDVIR